MEQQGTLGLERLSLGDAEHAQKRNPRKRFRKRARARNMQTPDAVNPEQGIPPSKALISPSGNHIRPSQAKDSELERANQRLVDQAQRLAFRPKPPVNQSVLAKTESRPQMDRVEPSSTPRSFTASSKKGSKSLKHARNLKKSANQKGSKALQPDQHSVSHSNSHSNTTLTSCANGHIHDPTSLPLQPGPHPLPQSLPASAGETPEPKAVVEKTPMIHLPAPKPTRAYLQQASRPPTKLLQPQRLLVVLDLNGTLLHRPRGSSAYTPRPSVGPFLDYCFENHMVMVWSSATPQNVRSVCDKLFTPAQQSLCLARWARDTFGLTVPQYRQRVQVYKRLDQIWQNHAVQQAYSYAPFKNPKTKGDEAKTNGGRAKGQGWGQHNTVLIDDSVTKAVAQPFNHLEVPEYTEGGVETIQTAGGETTDKPTGAVLTQVTDLLKEACTYDDISRFFFQLKADGRNGIKLPGA